MIFLDLKTDQTLDHARAADNREFIYLTFWLSKFITPIKYPPILLDDRFKSTLETIETSVRKLSPVRTFSIELVSLSTIKSSGICAFFLPQLKIQKNTH